MLKILQIFLYPFHWKHKILVVFPVYPLPVVPARGWAEVALRLYYKTFFVYRTCIRRGAPARPVCACVLCATVMHCSKSRTHTSHSTLHLISSPLSSSHLISSLLICHLSSSQLLSFHLSTAQPFASHRSSSQPISALLHVRKLLPSERNLLHAKTVPRRKLLHREGLPHRSLRHRCVYCRLQPLYPKKHNGSRSGFLRKTSLMQHSCSHYNAFCNITWQPACIYAHGNTTWQHNMATFMQPFHCDLQPEIQQAHRTMQTRTTAECRTQWRNQSHAKATPAAPASHGSYPSSPAAATLPEKTQCFALRLPPKNMSSPKSPLPKVTTSLIHRIPKSPLL